MFKIAIIGLGVMGKNHYKTLQQLKQVEIVGLCDPFSDSEFKHKLYRNLDEMLDETQLDGAIVATPTALHKQTAIKCIKRNINLLIEKPVASTIDDAKSILDETNNGKSKVLIGHIERFNPAIQALKNKLADKTIYSINIIRASAFPNRISDVGVLMDLAVHDVDLINFLTQKNVICKHIIKTSQIHKTHEDNAILSFKLEDNIIASITTNWLTPKKQRKITIVCKEAMYEADLIKQELIEYKHNSNNSYIVTDCFVQKGDALLKEIENFINYVQNGNPGAAALLEDGIKAMQIITN